MRISWTRVLLAAGAAGCWSSDTTAPGTDDVASSDTLIIAHSARMEGELEPCG
ncbi:MAG: hypothetical protein H6733_02855 [Alphaproteobacteria bacterium]|nr:hypothetical protein [Alphaproteobacteria bacterium]